VTASQYVCASALVIEIAISFQLSAFSIGLQNCRFIHYALCAGRDGLSKPRRMTQGRKNLCAIDQPWAGTTKVGSGVDSKNAAPLNGGKAMPIRVSRQPIHFLSSALD
jgi:hypothetical protein